MAYIPQPSAALLIPTPFSQIASYAHATAAPPTIIKQCMRTMAALPVLVFVEFPLAADAVPEVEVEPLVDAFVSEA